MTKRIQTYQDLLAEKERLQLIFAQQKEIVNEDITAIKEELAPVKTFISLAGKLVTRDSSNLLLNAGTNTIIDLVVKKLLLSRAGWITRIAVPFLLKNYSSHIISDSKDFIMDKFFTLLDKIKTKLHKKEPAGDEQLD